MTISEFNSINVGDTLTNKYNFGEQVIGYDYTVVEKTDTGVRLKEISMGNIYNVTLDEINMNTAAPLRLVQKQEETPDSLQCLYDDMVKYVNYLRKETYHPYSDIEEFANRLKKLM